MAMSMATAQSGATGATHLCGSLFEFSIEARDEILRSFAAIAGPNVDVEFDSNYFVIHCDRDDETSLSTFSQILANFIKMERERELDTFEDARIARVKGTYASSRVETITHGNGEAVGVNDEPVIFNGPHNTLNNTVNTAIGLLIEHETITRTWTPDVKGGLINLRSAQLTLGKIGALCHCRLEESDTMDVIIRADDEGDIEQAISKLRIIDTVAREQLAFPYIFSFPILEGELSVTLQMTALKDLNDRRVHTTLLSQSQLFDHVRSALVVSMVQGGELVPVKISSPQNSTSESLLWKDYPHMPFGIEMDGEAESLTASTSPALDHALLEKLATPTGQWLRQDPSEYEDAFQPSRIIDEESVLEDGKQPEVTVTYNLPLELTTPAKPSTKRMRAAKGSLKPKPQTTASVKDPQGSQVVSRVEVPLSEEVAVATGPETIAKENQQPIQTLQPPKIEGPYIPVTPPQPTTPSKLITSSASNRSLEWGIVHEGRGGRLIPVDDRLQHTGMDLVNDRLQDSSPSRKELRNTMGQRKPKCPITSTTTIVKSSEDAAKQILSLARSRQGPIIFELGIGRFLVHSQTGSSEFKKAFAVAEWSSVFPKKNSVSSMTRETTFTPRLTTNPLDIETILNVRLSQGRRLFLEEAHERRVTYIISCTTRTNEQVVIDVNQDGSFEIRGSNVLVGAVDWHFPKRSWDSRLQVTTQEPLMTSYQQQAQGIVDNMKVTVDPQGIEFSTATIDQELVIRSVLLRRETAHSAIVHPDLLLHLKEIQDMSVQQLPGYENNYRGLIQVPSKMISAGKLWWQASLTSITATATLKEGEALELGEVATWSPESIIKKDIFGDLYSLAYEVITKIDDVGFSNKGRKSASESKTATRTKTSPDTSVQETPPGFTTYW